MNHLFCTSLYYKHQANIKHQILFHVVVPAGIKGERREKVEGEEEEKRRERGEKRGERSEGTTE